VSQEATQHWPCDGRSIADVRKFVEARCQQWQLDGVTDDLVLMASELATNAVAHGRSPFRLRMSRSDDQIRLEVSDSNPQFPPTPAPPWRTTILNGPDAARLDDVDFHFGSDLDLEDVSGRGLTIVAALAASWGVSPASSAEGKTIWATCDL
jgi:hypothetical protein